MVFGKYLFPQKIVGSNVTKAILLIPFSRVQILDSLPPGMIDTLSAMFGSYLSNHSKFG
jgi:hypothetical protein